jgi:hypothetical protein
LQAYENYDEANANPFEPVILKFNGHANSLGALNTLVVKKLVSSQEVIDFVENIYIRHLKVSSYSYHLENSEISIFSHAPIGLNIVEALAKQFELEFNHSNMQGLMSTIDEINAKFQDYLKTKTVYSRLCPQNSMEMAYTNPNANLSNTPFVFTLWNRSISFIARHQHAELNGMKLFYVHGHDPKPSALTHVCNLDHDNNLGKTQSFNIGKMILFKSSEQTKGIQPSTLIEQYIDAGRADDIQLFSSVEHVTTLSISPHLLLESESVRLASYPGAESTMHGKYGSFSDAAVIREISADEVDAFLNHDPIVPYSHSNGIFANTDSIKTLGNMHSNHHSFGARFCFYAS